jgi:hypothetical protein
LHDLPIALVFSVEGVVRYVERRGGRDRWRDDGLSPAAS